MIQYIQIVKESGLIVGAFDNESVIGDVKPEYEIRQTEHDLINTLDLLEKNYWQSEYEV